MQNQSIKNYLKIIRQEKYEKQLGAINMGVSHTVRKKPLKGDKVLHMLVFCTKFIKVVCVSHDT